MAIYYYRVARDFPRALPYFKSALAAMPGNVDALYGLAAMERRQGKWVEAAEKFERLAALNPLELSKQSSLPGKTVEPLMLYNAVNTYVYMRRYEDAWRSWSAHLRACRTPCP